MKRIILRGSSAMLAFSLLSLQIHAAIGPIPATDGSRQIAVKIASEADIISTNVSDVETSVGVGLSTKVDRINNNMRTPITATTTIATSGSYRLANNFAGSITVTASNVDVDFNGFGMTSGGGITITGKNIHIHNGSILVNSTAAITVGDGGDNVVIEDMVLLNERVALGEPVVDITSSPGSLCRVWFKNCHMTKGPSAGSLRGLRCSSSIAQLYLQNCTISNFYYEACIISSVSRAVIENCIFDGCGSSAGPFALTLSAGTNNIVRNNLIRKCYRGIYIATASTRNQIMFNTIIGCVDNTSGCAIQDQNPSSTSMVWNNLSINNTAAPYTDSYLNVIGVTDSIGDIGVGTNTYVNVAMP